MLFLPSWQLCAPLQLKKIIEKDITFGLDCLAAAPVSPVTDSCLQCWQDRPELKMSFLNSCINEFSFYHDFINMICYTLAPYYLQICEDCFLALCSNPRHPAWVPLGTFPTLRLRMCQRGGEVHQARVDWRLLVINIKSIIGTSIESISCLHSSKTYAPSLPKIFDSCTFAFFTIQATLHLVVYCKKNEIINVLQENQTVFANITSVD